MNINGNSKDSNYRYTRPIFDVKIGGGGNGIYTVFNNMDKIGSSINHPSIVLFKYIAKVTGSSHIEARNQLTGSHTKESLDTLLQEYIDGLVMCPKCNIPETIPKLVGSKKRIELYLGCNACNNESPIISSKKNILKGVDIIIKYLQSGNEWKIAKGSMVMKTDVNNIITNPISEENEESVPFDDI